MEELDVELPGLEGLGLEGERSDAEGDFVHALRGSNGLGVVVYGMELACRTHCILVAKHDLLHKIAERVFVYLLNALLDLVAHDGVMQGEVVTPVAALDGVVCVDARAHTCVEVPYRAGLNDLAVLIQVEIGRARVGVVVLEKFLEQVHLCEGIKIEGKAAVGECGAIGKLVGIEVVERLLDCLADVGNGVFRRIFRAFEHEVGDGSISGPDGREPAFLRSVVSIVKLEQIASLDVGGILDAHDVLELVAVFVRGLLGGQHVEVGAEVGILYGLFQVEDVHASGLDFDLLGKEVAAAVFAIVVEVDGAHVDRRQAKLGCEVKGDAAVQQGRVSAIGQEDPFLGRGVRADEVCLGAKRNLVRLLDAIAPG